MADMVTIPLDVYIRLRVDAEENERFHDWDISCNWSDYGEALNNTDHDEDALNIEDWEAALRKELSEIDLTDPEAVQRVGWK